MHSHPSHQHDADTDWAAIAGDITLEGEVLMPYVTESIAWIADLCRREKLEVRRITDIGSGPGIGACVLAQQFSSASVVAVDASSEMLERASARARALGLADRMQTLYAELPAGLGRVGSVDLVWAAMVLHHVEDSAAVLRGLRSLLEPGGMLAIAEFGDSPRFLPDGAGRPGLAHRLQQINPADEFPITDYPNVFDAAGFETVAHRMVRVRLGSPLSEGARRVALGYLRHIRHRADDRLDEQDRQALDLLMDEDAPLGIMHREDVFLDVSRHIFVAGAAEAAP